MAGPAARLPALGRFVVWKSKAQAITVINLSAQRFEGGDDMQQHVDHPEPLHHVRRTLHDQANDAVIQLLPERKRARETAG